MSGSCIKEQCTGDQLRNCHISKRSVVTQACCYAGLQSPDLLQEVAETGDLDDLAALAAIIALSERASHPVSKAVSSLAQASSSSVEPAAIDKFQLVSGRFLMSREP